MSQYKTGTVSVANGSQVVTGTGTLWQSNVQPGDGFTVAGTGVTYDVASVDSDTQITLAGEYAGSTDSGLSYALFRDFTAPDGIPELSQGDIETATVFTRAMRKIQQRFALAGDAALIAAAGIYPSAADGLAGTVNGDYFFVTGGTDLILYTNESGEASEQFRYASVSAIAAYADSASGDAAASSQSATTALQASAQAGVYRDQASQIAGLDTVEQAVDEAIPQAPALVDGLRRSVEAASGGRMTVFYTAGGQPSYFVRQGKFLCENIAPGGELGTGVHEAFVFGGSEDAEIWVGAYQGVVLNGEAVSQPGLDPRIAINYDNAKNACLAAGAGFDIMSVWDWAAISLWCMANGFQPRGNTDWGRHHDSRWEVATREDNGVPGAASGSGRVLTGTGPAQWRHDETMAGIADMVGNAWEWLSGMKMVDGRIFLNADNDIGAESAYTDTGFDTPNGSATNWSGMNTSGAGDSLKRALIVPNGAADPVGSYWTNLSGERLPFRGGNRSTAGYAGLAALYLSDARSRSSSAIGFRPRFRNP